MIRTSILDHVGDSNQRSGTVKWSVFPYLHWKLRCVGACWNSVIDHTLWQIWTFANEKVAFCQVTMNGNNCYWIVSKMGIYTKFIYYYNRYNRVHFPKLPLRTHRNYLRGQLSNALRMQVISQILLAYDGFKLTNSPSSARLLCCHVTAKIFKI